MEHRIKAVEDKIDGLSDSIKELTKAMTEFVQYRVETVNNTKHIDVLFDKVDSLDIKFTDKHEENKKDIADIKANIYQTCDIKSKEMSTMEADLEHKIDNSEEKTEKHSTKLFLWSMAVIVTIASATFTTIMVLKSDDTDRDKIVTEKLDMLIDLARDTDKKVSLNSLEINHIKDELDAEKEHKHKVKL